MRTKHIIPGLVMATMLLASCYRKQDVVPRPENPVGGRGGKSKITVTAKHFDQTVDTGWVFIKYDATSRPANWMFDDSMQILSQNGTYQAVFDSLKRGNYYFYARGYSFDLMDSVTGGTKVTVIDTFDRTYNIFMDVRNLDGK
ncbi:MAG: hypothetical protein JST70_09725 [Bacteroidetes bacterium]|nr:hypothetical protein [Bacteroidota bacterium]